MASVSEVMQLCRLCLVKDEVNIPIFEEQGDIRQIFLKISACLPVKVARDDNLPKRICDGCSCKLEMLYQFWHTSAQAEKKLIKWINEITYDKSANKVISTVQHSNDPMILKQEVVDVGDTHSSSDELVPEDLNASDDAQDYLMQQQQLPYQNVEYFEEDGLDEEPIIEAPTLAATQPKRKRRAAEMQRAITANTESEDEDDVDHLLGAKITKTEEQSDEGDDPEPTTFVGLPTATDNEQPGPSGVGKSATDAPFDPLTGVVTQTVYECEVCTQIFATKKDFLTHHINQFGETFRCCRCEEHFKTTTDLYNHYEIHKKDGGGVVVEKLTEIEYSESPTNELLYILDGSQCINEVVIEDDCEMRDMDSDTSMDKSETQEVLKVEHVEHGYMLPSVFKGQLESKKRYKRRDLDSSLEVMGEEETAIEAILSSEATSSKSPSSLPKTRPKRRHEVPDFSATNYIMLNPTDELDIVHYKCLRCEQLFISKFGFFRHIEKGRCYINSCDVCSASFNKNSEFYDHYLADHTDRAICNFCFRTFMYEKNVKEHMLRHLDQFRHRCEQCNKGFYTIREYRNHYKNRHMGIRHKCDVCDRSFADEYYFKRHVATHEKSLSSKVQLSI